MVHMQGTLRISTAMLILVMPLSVMDQYAGPQSHKCLFIGKKRKINVQKLSNLAQPSVDID